MHTIIKDLLASKGREVWSVTPTTSVLDTLKMLADKDIGALLVMEGEQLVGIISERDFVRSIAKTEKCLIHSEVQNFMTGGVLTVEINQSVEDCMILMTRERIRHLPVTEDSKVVGMVSIGDVVKAMISNAESRISNLENFIEGTGYGH